MYSQGGETKSFEFEARGVDRTLSNIRRLISSLQSLHGAGYTTLWILEKLGLPTNIADAIRVLEAALVTIQAVRVALSALEIQLGPAGWALIAASIAGGFILSLEL